MQWSFTRIYGWFSAYFSINASFQHFMVQVGRYGTIPTQYIILFEEIHPWGRIRLLLDMEQTFYDRLSIVKKRIVETSRSPTNSI
jgi:hypothetical protein